MTHQEALKLQRRAIRGVKLGQATKHHSRWARKADRKDNRKGKWQ